MNQQPMLRVNDVRKTFELRRARPWHDPQRLHAVDGISFEVNERETFAIVGESGCGKSTTARLILRVERPTSGTVVFEGRDVHGLGGGELKAYRAAVQAVFQDPWSSLNPRMRVRDIVSEPARAHSRVSRAKRVADVADLLSSVGLEASAESRFPHEFSGGQRQRIAVARALALSPKLIVLDEPVSSLDVSVGAQLMNLLKDLQERLGVAYILISHSLGTVRYLSSAVMVMYLGRIMETGPTESLFDAPKHPYTMSLLAAAMPWGLEKEKRTRLSGDVPSTLKRPRGCPFSSRCWLRRELGNPAECEDKVPELEPSTSAHRIACHFAETAGPLWQSYVGEVSALTEKDRKREDARGA